MAVNDLAGSATYTGPVLEQLLAGDRPVKTNRAIAGASALAKYEIGALIAADNTVVRFVSGTHTAAQAVLVMQPCAAGGNCQYADEGTFNDTLLGAQAANATLYAASAMNTLAERKAFFRHGFKVDNLYPSL